MYNKDEGKWYDKTLSPITLDKLNIPNLKSINSGMGYKLYHNEESYIEAKAKAYKEEQENRKIINDRDHFHAALLKSTSEVFKPLTKNQDKSLQEEQIIVKKINDLSKSLTAIKQNLKRGRKERRQKRN